MKFLTRGDKILIILILILSSLPLLTLRDSMSAGSKQIIVNIDGEVKHEFLLNEKAESVYYTFDVVKEGVTYQAKLETKEGRVRLLRLPEEVAPLSIHSDTGWIDKPHQMIVALPAKLIVTVEDYQAESQSDIDIISY